MASNYPEQEAAGINESLVTVSGTTPSLDCSLANNFKITTSGNTTFTFSNAPVSGLTYCMTLLLTQGGSYTVTWPTSVDWGDGSAPAAPDSGKVDLYTFMTNDGGTTWYGIRAAGALA